MKQIYLILALLFLTLQSIAQTEHFQKGQIDAQLGIGFINTMETKLYAGYTDIGNKSKFKTPPILAVVDYGITDEISIGGYINYFHTEYVSYEDRETSKTFVIGARGMYHYELTPLLDTYAGAGLGYGRSKKFASAYFPNDPDVMFNQGDLYYQLTIGARYRFGNKLGVFAEAGYGVAALNIGLNVKL